MKQIPRYHPLLVALHWVLAVLIIAELAVGFFGLAATRSSEPEKIGILRLHMMGGVLILALRVFRFIVRMRTSRPPAATTGYPLLDRIAPVSHYGFYVAGPDDGGKRLCDRDHRRARRDRVWLLGCPVTAHLDELSALCRTRLLCDAPCRLRRFARACYVLPPVRQKRRTVPADVFRATSVRALACSGRRTNTGDDTMTDRRPKIAALIADAFQEEEYFFPKVALNEAGYQVEVVSSRKEPVEIYSYFARTGLLDVERAITEARPEDYVGVLIPGGAKSPALLAEDPRVTKFVQDVSARGGVIACICRGSMLAARSQVVAGRRMTGFNDSAS